ncbi:MAG: alpha/beta hydrolase [Pseudaminobacter sp.]
MALDKGMVAAHWFARITLALGLVIGSVALVTDLKASDSTPWKSNIAYGDDPAQMLDIYRPDVSGPVPMVLYIHGGGWWNGDKQYIDASQVRYLNDRGIAFVTINYRNLSEAKRDGIFPPLLASLQDARRSLDFIRRNRDELQLDPDRIAVYGSSSGGFNALWLGLSSELPGTGLTTRGVRAVAALDAQTSIDPEQMRRWVGPGLAYGGHAFGLAEPDFEEFLAKRSEFEPYFAQLSPAALVGSNSPPIFLLYGSKTSETNPGDMFYVHSPNFGIGFAEVAKERGANVTFLQDGESDPGKKIQLLEFLVESLKD